MFRQAWSYLNDFFYDPVFHGVDWSAMQTRYARYADGARTPDELRRVISLMLGELNASHLGIGARRERRNGCDRTAGRAGSTGTSTRPTPPAHH